MYRTNFYDKKWSTKENAKVYDKLESKYLSRSYAYSDCPPGWSREVLDLFDLINQELGVERNISTINGYHIKKEPFRWFITDPIVAAYSVFVFLFGRDSSDYSYPFPDTIFRRLLRVVSKLLKTFFEAFTLTKIIYVNPILNKIFKPKFRLDQVKDKYGVLTIYYRVAPAFEQWVEDEINKVKIRLSLKGVYASLDELYLLKSSKYVDCESDPDLYQVEKVNSLISGKSYLSFTRTTMRRLMKEMGVNLNDLELKFLEKQNIEQLKNKSLSQLPPDDED